MTVKQQLVCDWCGAVADASFRGGEYPAGWLDTPEADLCPTCTGARGAALANVKRLRTGQGPIDEVRCFDVEQGRRCTRYLAGAEAERAAVVAWLSGCSTLGPRQRRELADAIGLKAHHGPQSLRDDPKETA